MKGKKILKLLFFSVMFAAALALPMGAEAAESEWKYDFPPEAATVSIRLDGKQVLLGEAAIIDNVTYVPLRSMSELLGADSIEWDAVRLIATVRKGSTVIRVGENAYYIEAAGRYFYSITTAATNRESPVV